MLMCCPGHECHVHGSVIPYAASLVLHWSHCPSVACGFRPRWGQCTPRRDLRFIGQRLKVAGSHAATAIRSARRATVRLLTDHCRTSRPLKLVMGKFDVFWTADCSVTTEIQNSLLINDYPIIESLWNFCHLRRGNVSANFVNYFLKVEITKNYASSQFGLQSDLYWIF